ncbi:hypothetical protein QYE76_005861 [Lolium multiflorum]|uniref:Uncharacterized protein n=1 Tax=Lolium multiflorum TaxID=4521 RepID=A0AAD8W3U9_LOLMU|nr:hypothetical protein QYE76_005861 [Lolium multiflorum]
MDGGKRIQPNLDAFVPHPPARLHAYADLEESTKMTFGSFHFLIGKEGSHRLAPIFSGTLAAGSDFSGSPASSIESGDEKASPPSFIKPAAGGELADLFGDMTFRSFTDSDLGSDFESIDNLDFIDKSTSIREVFVDLYDGVTDLEDDENKVTIYHQVCAIGESSRQEDEASEAIDDVGNPYIDPADLTRGIGNKYIGATPREKVRLPQEAWDRAQRAMNDKCDKDFHKLSETFRMQAEYEASKLTTNYDVLPDGGRSLQEQAFDTSKDSKEVQIHPTNPKKMTSIMSNLDSA